MAKQTKQMFTFIDSLTTLSTNALRRILILNNQYDHLTREEMLRRIGDIMTFGSLVPCNKCNGGQYVFKSGVGYQCQGYISEYTKCKNIKDEPKRNPFAIAVNITHKKPFLSFTYKSRKRVIQKLHSSDNVQLTQINNPKIVKHPLKNVMFILIGFPIWTEKEYSEKIKEFGGIVIDKKHKSYNLAIIITIEAIFTSKLHPLIKHAHLNKEIPVVGTEFVTTLTEINYDLAKQIKKNLLCNWMVDDDEDDDVSSWLKSNNKDYMSFEDKYLKSSTTSSKLTSTLSLRIKNGAVVDPLSGLVDIGHVLRDKDDCFYSCVLIRTSIEDGKNSYYKLQLIKSDFGNDYFIFESGGRIGTHINWVKLSKQLSKNGSIQTFQSNYTNYTGNVWDHPFVMIRGLYSLLEIDYGEREQMNKLIPKEQDTNLPIGVQELICLIFDVERIHRSIIQFDLNLTLMPLGKISIVQIQSAYSILNMAKNLIKKISKPRNDDYIHHQQLLLLDYSNKFYSLIPHNFGILSPPILNKQDLIESKCELLDNLLEIELAYEIHLEGNKDSESPIDSNYKLLKSHLYPLTPSSQEYVMLENYLKNTHADTHDDYSLDVENIFTVNRSGEEDIFAPFKKFHNRKLLWHGSRVTNYAGILSKGLCIAPPDVIATGYMFGKGVYFTDMVSKAANYCRANSNDSTGILLVCEVALGDIHEMRNAEDTLTQPPNNCHSVKGLGKTHPNPAFNLILPDGVEVPLGKPSISTVGNFPLLYNEYVVYNPSQINIRYLMRVKFNFTPDMS